MSMTDNDTFPPDRKRPIRLKAASERTHQGTPEPPSPQPGQLERSSISKPNHRRAARTYQAADWCRSKSMAQRLAIRASDHHGSIYAKAQLMVPAHFHGNVDDCLAIIDIATRAGLSPYMVAAKTYKDRLGKGIAFESQLYHAFFDRLRLAQRRCAALRI